MATRSVTVSRPIVKNYSSSLVFSGSAGVIDLGTTNPFTGSFYFSAWIKWAGPNGGFQTVFAKRDSYAANGLMFSAALDSTTGGFNVDTVTSFIPFGYVFPQGKWTHICWVHDTSGSHDILYVNGELYSTQGLGTLGTKTTAAITIGATQSADYFNGKMDDIVIGTTVPTATNVFTLYTQGIAPGTVWRKFNLDEGTGTTATDSSSNATNGTITGATYSYDAVRTPRPKTPFTRYSLDFTKASSQYVDLGNTYLLAGQTNASISFWLKTFNTITVSNELTPYCERATSGNDIFKIELQSTGRLRFTYRDTANTLNQLSSSTSRVLNDNEWHHVVLTKSGTAITLYVDGRVDFTGTLTATDTLTNANQRVRIGGDAQDSNVYYGGRIAADFKLYRRALSSEEVTMLYNQFPIVETNLYLSYKFNEGTGTTITDYSGNNFTGTLVNTPTFQTDVLGQRPAVRSFGTTLSFALNSNNKVDCGSISLTNTSQLSIAMWIKPRNTATQMGLVMRRFDLIDDTFGFFLTYSSPNYLLDFNWGSGAASQTYTTNRPVVPQDRWVHVGMAFDFANPGTLDYYVNGKKTTVSRVSGSGSAVNISGTLLLGIEGFNDLDYYGLMDDVAIYTRKLTQTEMENIFYRSTYATSGLNRFYKFDEGSGSTANDSSGNGNNGTITGATYSTDVVRGTRPTV
jgi:hypothetical protein